mmetsp:Transcript_26240/g.41620  ORF Transcript_26240/g.41620 Transcript_26240/m.41620 type:complete len:82 (-) Transcript_26240:2-247(-)
MDSNEVSCEWLSTPTFTTRNNEIERDPIWSRNWITSNYPNWIKAPYRYHAGHLVLPTLSPRAHHLRCAPVNPPICDLGVSL